MQSFYSLRDNKLVLDPVVGSKNVFTIHDLPADDKPREKLLAHGPEALSIRELTMLLLITGTTKENLVDMTNRIVRDYGERSIFTERDPTKLAQEFSIPITKACQIVAASELGRRQHDMSSALHITIKTARDVYLHLRDMRNLNKEHLRGLYLDSHGRILRDEIVSIGTINTSLIHPREVFHPAIIANAAAVIIAHNHPSGDVTPSTEDILITKQLIESGDILGIPLLDHVVITKDAYSSVFSHI